jgi:hypothetical protein
MSILNTRCSRRAQFIATYRVADQVIERARLAVRRQPGVLEVALDQAAPLQRPADTQGDLLDERLQLLRAWLAHNAHAAQVLRAGLE